MSSGHLDEAPDQDTPVQPVAERIDRNMEAFAEMANAGWISGDLLRIVAVQAAGCEPIVSAFKTNRRFAEEQVNAATMAAELRVPKAIGDFLILDAIRESRGVAVAVSDDEMLAASREIGRLEGIFVAPEGGACYAALKSLRASGHIQPTVRRRSEGTGQ